ncbi:MAG: hypothetical protein HS132_18180 [Planctomycetia bacterium]|nr:hypothetical protein [Planctomycetia bacterium]
MAAHAFRPRYSERLAVPALAGASKRVYGRRDSRYRDSKRELLIELAAYPTGETRGYKHRTEVRGDPFTRAVISAIAFKMASGNRVPSTSTGLYVLNNDDRSSTDAIASTRPNSV